MLTKFKCSVCRNRAENPRDIHRGLDTGEPLVFWNGRTGSNETACFSCAASNPKALYRCCRRAINRALEG
jgi:hypothetical protein